MSAREALIAKIKEQGDPNDPSTPSPVVSLEDFFEGNSDIGSIGCNLIPQHPGLDTFYQTLQDIRARPEVYDVLVEIYEVDESDPEMWPFSESIYVLSSAPQATIEEWVAPLRPDEVYEGWSTEKPSAVSELPEGITVYQFWWD